MGTVDAATVRAAQRGDEDALATIVDDFMPTVLGVAYGLCGDWDAAGDIAQEAFATMVTRIGDLRDPAALPGWLVAVVRTAARRQRRAFGAAQDHEHLPGPEDIVIAHDDARRLRAALEALPAELRIPMVLHYFAGLSLADVSALCDIPLSTVKKRMRVARARLRERMDKMADAITCRPVPDEDPSDVVRMYTAMRSRDVKRVAAILDARPDLVDAREHWTRADSFAHRLPWNRGGTPLLRAVERSDIEMVRVLLDRGADPNGACTCAGGESPLWVGAVQHETEIVRLLLDHGADPNSKAFAGASALDVARRRGYGDVAQLLLDAGADASLADRGGRAPGADVPSQATGIKAVDLWCPLPERGLAHLTPGFGVGAVVLLAELSYRFAVAGRAVVWSGFVQSPTDLGDVHHALAESDVGDLVTVSMAAPTEPVNAQVAALDRGVAASACRPGSVLVVFAETGRLQTIDERLPALAARDGLTIVVAPLDGSVDPPRSTGSPYLASIVFDVERARRGRWPAVGAASWSKVAEPAMAELADRARAHMTDALEDYLAQPFFVAEAFTGRTGEAVPPGELAARVLALLLCQQGDALGVEELRG
jgi:RNA polymerase sigma-70 factor (ECF subfamily)